MMVSEFTPWAEVGADGDSGAMRRQWQWPKARATPMLRALVATAMWSAAAAAQTIDPNLWGVDNRALTLARSGNTLFVGGAFGSVGPQTGGGVPVRLRDGLAVETYPRVAGEVKTVVADGEGGWYVGGDFVGVGGVPRLNLAHILRGGRVAPWDPGPDRAVRTLVIHHRTLYVGGDFGEIGGRVQEGIAAFDLETGKLSRWAPRIGAWSVYRYVAAILVHDNAVYVGGAFSSIGGAIRTCLAAIDARTGQPLAWTPALDGQVECLAVHGDVLYVGGYFFRIAGRWQPYLASLDMETGQLTPHQIPVVRVPEDCRCDLGPYVGVLVTHGNQLYVGGSFTSIGGKSRGGLAAIDLKSSEVSDWDPQLVFSFWPSPYCHAVVVRGTTVYVGGYFSGIGGRYQVYLGALDTRTGVPTDWVPLPNGQVDALALADIDEGLDEDKDAARREGPEDRERGSGETMYVGGWFTGLGPLVRRTGLAAFDLGSGKVLPWDPEPNGLVHSLVIGGNTVYVGGDFTTVGGQPRSHIAALDATGRATSWNPGADGTNWLGIDGSVWSLALGNSALYAGGSFSSAGGLSRRNLAAFDTLSGAVTAWNPGANDLVYAVAVAHDAVYAAGFFTRVGGQAHWTLAALDAVTGSSKPWDVSCDGIVGTLLASDSTLYAGGTFDHIGGVARENVAAFNMATGVVTQWNPDVEIAPTVVRIQSLAADANAVYIGGEFATVGGAGRSNLAAVDRVAGALLPWNPATDPDGLVWALAAYGDAVYAGGGFSRIGFSAVNGLAAISPALALDKRAFPVSVDLGSRGPVACSVRPNPIQAGGVVRFRLPAAATVSLTVYDLQGRRVGTLLNREARPAGEYRVALLTQGWPEGNYFMRLEAGGLTTTEKFVVVK